MLGNRRWRPIIFGWLPVVGWAALIVIGSSIPDIPTPRQLEFPLIDKLGHLFEYAVFGFLLARSLGMHWSGRARSLAGVVAAALAFGLLDEFHQQFVPGRYFEGLDLAADVVGVVLGWFTYRARPFRGNRLVRWVYRT
jgi:VanZ family protein